MYEADPAVFGGTALISERVDGRRPGQFFPELEKPREHGPELMTHFAQVLARLHTMPLDRLAGSHLDTTPKPVTPEQLDEEVLDLADAVDKGRGPNVASMQIAVDWLRRHLDLVPGDTPIGLNHGDIGLHNMLADRGRITALLDWELPHVGPIAYELATVHTAVTSLTTWDAFVAAYLDAGGPPAAVDPGVIAFYRVQKCLWLAWYSRAASQLYWSSARRDIISAGVSFDSQFRHSIKVARAMDNAISVVWP
jgi:aminoglycoside phosphotransferase (APT) family kinase protein